MTVEESIHVIFYETNNYEQAVAKINTEEEDQNIFLKNLNSNTKIQLIESSIKLCSRKICQKIGRFLRICPLTTS